MLELEGIILGIVLVLIFFVPEAQLVSGLLAWVARSVVLIK